MHISNYYCPYRVLKNLFIREVRGLISHNPVPLSSRHGSRVPRVPVKRGGIVHYTRQCMHLATLWGDSTLLRCEDIVEFHRWLVGDLPIIRKRVSGNMLHFRARLSYKGHQNKWRNLYQRHQDRCRNSYKILIRGTRIGAETLIRLS